MKKVKLHLLTWTKLQPCLANRVSQKEANEIEEWASGVFLDAPGGQRKKMKKSLQELVPKEGFMVRPLYKGKSAKAMLFHYQGLVYTRWLESNGHESFTVAMGRTVEAMEDLLAAKWEKTDEDKRIELGDGVRQISWAWEQKWQVYKLTRAQKGPESDLYSLLVLDNSFAELLREFILRTFEVPFLCTPLHRANMPR